MTRPPAAPGEGSGVGVVSGALVELRGFEPRTFCMPCRRATNCAIAPEEESSAYRGRLTASKPSEPPSAVVAQYYLRQAAGVVFDQSPPRVALLEH